MMARNGVRTCVQCIWRRVQRTHHAKGAHMTRGHVLISGAGIAGTALAYWLGRAGYQTTVVERAADLRGGGQAVDFRGPVHRAVLERMGLWLSIHEHRTNAGDLLLVDRRDTTLATLPASMLAGDVEILRGDLV